MITVEEIFENYFRKYIKSRGIVKREDIERAYLAELERWRRTPLSELSELTPLEYLNSVLENRGFTEYAEAVFSLGLKVGDLTIEALKNSENAYSHLKNAFINGGEKLKLLSAELLGSMDGAAEFLTESLLNRAEAGKAVTDAVFDALNCGRDGVDYIILKKTDNLKNVNDRELLDMLLDILSNYGSNDTVLALLTERFLEGENLAFYANLLGRVGNDGTVSVLKEFAASKELTPREFMEIRSAVERLGGEI